jgi:DNA-binding transcriptional LysR family regulator
MIDLKLIRDALTLGEYRNFARAADALRVAQPTLSRSIASLERRLGVRLFDRDRKGLETTAFGRILLERGEALLRSEADIRREIHLLAGLEAGLLRVAAGPYAGEVSAATAAARLISAHPRLRVEVLTASPQEVISEVLAGRFDLGIADVGPQGAHTRLHRQPLGPHRLYLACRPGHALTRVEKLTLQDVLAFPLASTLLRGEVRITQAWQGAFGSTDPRTGDFTPAILVNSLAMAREIARRSDALFLGTASMIAPEVEARRLVRLAFRMRAMRTGYSLFWLRDRSVSPAARAFMDALLAVEAELLAPEKRDLPATRLPMRGGRRRVGARTGTPRGRRTSP